MSSGRISRARALACAHINRLERFSAWSPLAKTVWTGSSGRLGVSDRTTTTETLALINKSKRAVVFYAHVKLSRKAEYGDAN